MPIDSTEENKISMYLSAGHKTAKNILAHKSFTVSMADAAHVIECDYVGVVSMRYLQSFIRWRSLKI